MELFSQIFIFLLGLIIGSFLNCLIYRLEAGEGFLKGRSYCPHCKHKLGLLDLVPVLSFICLWGLCRYCHKKISWQYPLVEMATGLIFLLIYSFQLGVFNYVIAPFLIVIFVYDLKHYIIPDKVIYTAIGVALVYNLLKYNFLERPDFFISALGAAGFFALIVLISRGRGMGVGDIKLAFLMGLILGYPNILTALFLSFFIGAIMGLGLIILGKKTLKSEVPFGPFLVTGTYLAVFLGSELINWYLNLFYL